MSRKRKIIFRIVSVLIGLTLALFVGEFVVRLLWEDKIVLYPRFNSVGIYGGFEIRRLRPNTLFTNTSADGSFNFQINNKGFRDDYDIEYEKPKNCYRIFCVGDSHTEGLEVNQHETFSFLLQQFLGAEKKDVRVINAGVGGFSNSEEMILIENELIKYQPDAVILGFYANDFQDNLRANLFQLEKDSLLNISKKYLPGVGIQEQINKWRAIRWLSENSYLYSYVFNTIWKMEKMKATEESINKTDLHIEKNIPDGDEEFAAAFNIPSVYQINFSIKILGDIFSFCRMNNIRFILLDIPKCKPFDSSIPVEYLSQFRDCCDTLFYSLDMKSDYEKISNTHVPHGQNHISASTHNLIAKKLSQYFLTVLK